MTFADESRAAYRRIGGQVYAIQEIRDEAGRLIDTVTKPLKVEFRLRDVGQLLAGAFMMGIPVALAEEVWVLRDAAAGTDSADRPADDPRPRPVHLGVVLRRTHRRVQIRFLQTGHSFLPRHPRRLAPAPRAVRQGWARCFAGDPKGRHRRIPSRLRGFVGRLHSVDYIR